MQHRIRQQHPQENAAGSSRSIPHRPGEFLGGFVGVLGEFKTFSKCFGVFWGVFEEFWGILEEFWGVFEGF